MLPTRPLIFKFSSSFTNLLVSVQRAQFTISGTVTFMYHSFSIILRGCGTYPSFRFLSISLFGQPGEQSSQFCKLSSFWLIIIRSGRLAEIRWSVCMSKSQRRLCVSFSWTDSGLCRNHLLGWSNLIFLHSSQWITFPTQSCLVLLSFYANLMH